MGNEPVPEPPGRDHDFGDRVRAARGYAGGMSQSALAERIRELFPGAPISARTIKRVERGDKSPRGPQSVWVEIIARATGVPEWFLEYGWAGAPGNTDLRSEQARMIEMGVLQERLTALGEWPVSAPLREAIVSRLVEQDVSVGPGEPVETVVGRIRARLELMEEDLSLMDRREIDRQRQRELVRRELNLSSDPSRQFLDSVDRLMDSTTADPMERARMVREIAERASGAEFRDELMELADAYEMTPTTEGWPEADTTKSPASAE
jgi:transcriptional regulator with XRE-family HTH domain